MNPCQLKTRKILAKLFWESHIMVVQQAASEMVNAEQVQAFQASLRGQLIRPGDRNYDEVRSVYNGMIDKHPALIARCANVADVIRTVNFARENGLTVAVRGG